jgi:fatty acid CoA ligase FadD9
VCKSGADAPVLQTVSRAAAALLGTATTDLSPDAHFTDLGGDSLSALTFGNLLREIFDIDVPVGVIVNPANDLQAIADCIEVERQGTKRPSFASVHGRDATEVHSSDLTLDKFIDAPTLAAAPTLPRPSAEVRTVLLTGATGFLGRYLVKASSPLSLRTSGASGTHWAYPRQRFRSTTIRIGTASNF